MKLNWFSPLPHARTDIAHYTVRVLEALASRAEITLWTDQTRWDASLDDYAEVRSYQLTRMPWAELNRGDMSIYHLGNDLKFHSSIWQVSQRHPGIVVLHDFRLQHFFAGTYLNQWRDLDAYLTQMEFYYGDQGRRDAQHFYNKVIENDAALYIDEMAERYPLSPLALENALGALVHTRESFENLKRENLCPVHYAPLPFAASHVSSRAQILNSEDHAIGAPARLIVFGYLGLNRRLDALFKALAGLPEKDRFHLDIYGHIADEKSVRKMIAALGLKRLVTLHGFVPEAELDAALQSAHLAINLRFPTMGEASGSQLRIWAHALPSLVTQVGWYATLPAAAVRFVRPEHEIEDIRAHLRAYLDHPVNFTQMGERGRKVLEEHHAPEAYTQALLELVESARRFRPLSPARSMMMRSGAEMGEWLAATTEERALIKLVKKKTRLRYGRGGIVPRRSRSLLRHALSLSSWRRLLRRLMR